MTWFPDQKWLPTVSKMIAHLFQLFPGTVIQPLLTSQAPRLSLSTHITDKVTQALCMFIYTHMLRQSGNYGSAAMDIRKGTTSCFWLQLLILRFIVQDRHLFWALWAILSDGLPFGPGTRSIYSVALHSN